MITIDLIEDTTGTTLTMAITVAVVHADMDTMAIHRITTDVDTIKMPLEYEPEFYYELVDDDTVEEDVQDYYNDETGC